MKKVEIYTDGACSRNPGPGGWGALLRFGTTTKEICGGEAQTTNNRMELKAAIKALAALKESCDVSCYTDSTYVKNGILEWITAWKAKGWKTANKKPVKNQDLWQELDKESQRHRIEWHWIKGHAGHPGNEKADELARKGMSCLENIQTPDQHKTET